LDAGLNAKQHPPHIHADMSKKDSERGISIKYVIWKPSSSFQMGRWNQAPSLK